MERPSSRGAAMAMSNQGLAKAPTGSAVPMPDRPFGGGILGATGQIPPGTAAGRPPGTAMRGAGSIAQQPPPGTAYKRMGTAQGRPGTGQQGAAPGARTGANVQVENRPITNHGVSGIKTAVGGGRRVLDKNYFIAELRQKRSEVASVTQRMREEIEALEKRQGHHNSMEKRAGSLSKEVKTLQEQLADFNTVLDKVGSQAPVYSIQAEVGQLRERNQQMQRRVDDVVSEKYQMEQKMKQAEARIMEIQASMESRLASMAPSQRQAYQDMAAEQQSLQVEAKAFEERLDSLDKQLAQNEEELQRNPLKKSSLQLHEQIRQLTERKYELQQEEERSRMSPEEQKEQLMLKVKRDNQEMESMAQQVRELQDSNKKLEVRVNSMQGQNPAVNAAEEAQNREKFEELVAKERDLSNFMDSFPSRRAAKLDEMRQKQDNIVAILERISKLQGIATSALPSQKKFREMQDELEYKRMQLENTAVTQERLKEELALRRTELEKIDTLDEKIKSELASIQEKSTVLNKEIEDFGNVETMRAKAEARRQRLEGLRVALAKRKDLLRTTVAEKSLKYQARKAQLQENNLQISLERSEQKLRQMMQSIHQMDDFIRTKESETNYKSLAINILQLSDDLNLLVKTRL